MLWHPKTLQNLAMYNVFFHFWPFFHCRKATKMTQNSISIPSCAQTPKNPRKMSKTPPYSGLGAKTFLAPPAKADIATAILTNVIEHLVLLLPPNKHAFTAKAVWADFCSSSCRFIDVETHTYIYTQIETLDINIPANMHRKCPTCNTQEVIASMGCCQHATVLL